VSFLRLNLDTPPAFTNGFTVTKDWNGVRWLDGGGDAWDAWGNPAIAGFAITLPTDAANAADGTIGSATVLTGALDLAVARIGWPRAGVFVAELIFDPTVADTPRAFTCGGDSGAGGSIQMGTVTRTVNIGGTDYRVDTTWINDGAQDVLTGEPQATVTILPMLAAEMLLAGAANHSSSRVSDVTTHTSRALTKGVTWIVQWGQATVAAVQDWIAAALTPHASLPVVPGIQPMALPAPAYLQPFAPTWPAPIQVLPEPHKWRGSGGQGRITRTVLIKGTPNDPELAKVRLYRDRDGALLEQKWNDPDTGVVIFDGYDLDEKYTLLAYHAPTRAYRAVAHDDITPVLIP